MSTNVGDAVGNFACINCGCCGGVREFKQHENPQYMTCKTCGCNIRRPDTTSLMIRLYVDGSLTLDAVQNLLTTARLLGAPEETVIMKESNDKHYVVIPNEYLKSQVEIAEITGRGKPTKSSR